MMCKSQVLMQRLSFVAGSEEKNADKEVTEHEEIESDNEEFCTKKERNAKSIESRTTVVSLTAMSDRSAGSGKSMVETRFNTTESQNSGSGTNLDEGADASQPDEIPDSENKMVCLSLFKRYQGSEKEDQALSERWKSLDPPQNMNIRWLKSVDYRAGYGKLCPLNGGEGHVTDILPSDAVFKAEDSLEFKKLFRAAFPDRNSNLKMLVIT